MQVAQGHTESPYENLKTKTKRIPKFQPVCGQMK